MTSTTVLKPSQVEFAALCKRHTACIRGEAPHTEAARLATANLAGLRAMNYELSQIDLRKACLSQTDFTDSIMRYAFLEGIYAPGVIFDGVNLRGSDMSHAHLEFASAKKTNFERVRLRHSNLRYATLVDSAFRDLDASGVSLAGAVLKNARIVNVSLHDADLRSANFQGAIFDECSLLGARLDGAIMPAGYTWETYLSEVVPDLLKAGGAPIERLAAIWDATFSTTLLCTAFGVKSLTDIPKVFSCEIRLFVMLFDSGLIPKPTVS